MPGLKIKKGDTVAVIAGKDLGTQGRVLDVIPKKRRIIIEGVNTITRHEKVKQSRRGTPEGGITHKEAAVAISNVALVCPTDGPTRVGYRIEQDGSKTRICKKCGTDL
jgi:large subunit ribosomal protein L24